MTKGVPPRTWNSSVSLRESEPKVQ
jgi:hypothetical protein